MDTNSENLDSVLKKLQKLQKLYDSAKEVNSEGEAEAAAIAIQRLLTLHNLSMEDIKMDDENVGENIGISRTSKRSFGDQSSARNIGYTDGRMVQINKQIDSNNIEGRISL